MADNNDPVFQIQRVYMKEASLEQPNSPAILLEQEQPAVDIQLGVEAQPAAENIFECTRTRVRVDEMEPGVWKRDYALVELTRRAVGRAPLAVRDEPIILGEPVSVISASAGLPLKFDSGAHVLDARAHMNDFFRLDSDTGHGSSGAPVFDAAGRAVGIVVRGRRDYLLDQQAVHAHQRHALLDARDYLAVADAVLGAHQRRADQFLDEVKLLVELDRS